MDNPKLTDLGQFTPEGKLTPGYGDSYLFLVGRDDVHGILKFLLGEEKLGVVESMYGWDDQELNDIIMEMIKSPSMYVQLTLDKSQAGGVHEKKILNQDEIENQAGFTNSVAIGESPTHQIAHTKSLILLGQNIAVEGSANWSESGEGIGIDVHNTAQPKGWKAQNNTVSVTTNPIFIARLKARLDVEHRIAKNQQNAKIK